MSWPLGSINWRRWIGSLEYMRWALCSHELVFYSDNGTDNARLGPDLLERKQASYFGSLCDHPARNHFLAVKVEKHPYYVP